MIHEVRMKTPRTLMIAATLAMIMGASVDAEAQTVKRYDDAGDGSQSQMYIPGMPVPQPTAAPAAGNGEAAASEEGENVGSYQISMYGTRSENQRRARTSEIVNR